MILLGESMKNLKENILNFFSNKKHLYWTIAILVVSILAIIGLIIFIVLSKRYDYLEIENMLVDSSKAYLINHKEINLTNEDNTYEIEATSLINEEYLKDFSKLSTDTNCQAKVTVTYNHGEFRYTPILTCDNYETKVFKDTLLLKENIVTSGDGLYQIEDVYRFKGDYVNNYFKFANKLWRLFKIENNRLYLVLADTINDKNSAVVYDDRYNYDLESDKGLNDYDESRIKDTLANYYNNDFKDYKAYIVNHEACKNTRSEIDTDFVGAIDCFTTTDVPISLMAVYDFIGASRDPLCLDTMSSNCSNYNYLTITKNKWWLINGTNENSSKVYNVNQNGDLGLDYANSKKNIRYVITLPDDVLYKDGNGTENNPYTIYLY